LNCDICGRVILGQAFKVQVEGAKMLVCSNCQSLGKPYKEEPRPQPPVVRSTSFLPTRKRTTELPREMAQFDLAEDLAERVRKYRMKLALSQEELAKRVKEKLSVIQKIETGKMTPDMRLCRALEHELKVKLLLPHTETAEVPKSAVPSEVTLGDIVRVKDKSKASNT
jgi:putative transcription factor